MTPQEMKQLAELLQKVPGIKSIELKDVEGLAQLLREAPEIGSIEVKGLFGTGVVITRTSPRRARADARCRRRCRPRSAPPAPAAEGDAARGAAGRRARAQGDQVTHGGDVLQGARARAPSRTPRSAPGSARDRRSASSRR